MTFKTVHKVFLVLFLFLIFTQTGCSLKKKKTTRLQNFDSELWIQDKNGCSGDRNKLKDNLLALKHNMRGLKTNDIESYLGKPDAQELYDRGQRYYIYFIEPGPKCDSAKNKPQALFVRFSAIGVANEFTIKPL